MSRRASTLRLGLLTATLAAIVGGFAWFGDAPRPFATQPTPTASSSPEFSYAPADAMAAHVRQNLEQDLRLASLALDIRQNQDSIARLSADAQSLAASVGALSSGVELLKSDLGTAHINAAASIARLEESLREVKLAVVTEPMPLGDPALHELARLGDPQIAARLAEAEAGQPTTTGGLPGLETSHQASVEVNLNKMKPRIRSPKAISGWHIHTARDDLALVVESEGTHYEVKPGELLPGVGIVRAIKKRGEQWVVLTSKGMITEAK